MANGDDLYPNRYYIYHLYGKSAVGYRVRNNGCHFGNSSGTTCSNKFVLVRIEHNCVR
jgi:hypothetical protein